MGSVHLFLGDSKMAAFIAAVDWSKTPLGPIESWPQSLRTMVSLCLNSNFPTNIIWGPNHTQIYNDGYRVTCGTPHPQTLGESYPVTWAAAWSILGESFKKALSGQTSSLENQGVFLERKGYPEERFFNFSYTPVRNDAGKIVGLLHSVVETTSTTLVHRRNATLQEIHIKTRNTKNLETAALVKVQANKDQISNKKRGRSSRKRIPTYPKEVLTGSKQEIFQEDLVNTHLDPLSKKILVVDDNLEMRNYLRRLLIKKWNVITAKNKSEALKAIDQGLPNLVLSAVMMHEMNGHQLLEAVRAKENTKNIPFIFLSGRLEEEAIAERLISSADDYIIKPFSDRELILRIENHLRIVFLHQEVFEQQEKIFAGSKMNALGEMAGNISHEINTPLASIILRAAHLKELILSEPFDRAVGIEWTNKIESTAFRIAKIIKGLRTFSRDSETDPFEPITVKSVIEDTLSLCGEKFRNSGVEIISPEISEDLYILCRPSQICQVLINLLNNAFDVASELPEKWVKLEVSDEGAFVKLSVIDSGKGIKAEMRNKIMLPFVTSKAQGKGLGIGLSISKRIVDTHQGKLEIDTTCKNTKFFILLPKAQLLKLVV